MNRSISRTVQYLLLAIAVIVAIFPVFYLLTLSLKSQVDMYLMPPRWIFVPNVLNFVQAFVSRSTYLNLINSVVITAATVALSLIVSAFGGYGFSRFRFKGKTALLLTIISTRMIPPITLVFPIFLTMHALHLLDTKLSLILAYSTFNIPFGVLVLSSFMDTIPTALDESARIDGCERIRAFFLVILPIAKPGILSAMILSMLLSWKDYLWAVRLTYSSAAQTLPVVLSTFNSSNNQNWGVMTAIAIVTILPPFIFLLSSQKYMVAGLTAGALKG